MPIDPMPPRTYPHGVPCWIDLERSDPHAAAGFYAGLFGWTFENAMPPGAPGAYLIASLDGKDAAAIGSGAADSHWRTYVAVDDADAAARAVAVAGGTVTEPPQDAGPGGRAASCEDPQGAAFRLWQARRRLGAQVANVPGAWNFSILHAADPATAQEFYAVAFGWGSIGADPALGDAMVTVPGYGRHLAATVDRGILERQKLAPEGFADVVAGITRTEGGDPPSWRVQFTVEDRDRSAARVQELGGTVLSTRETQWTLEALVADPAGARLTLSQFAPRA